MSYKSLLIKKNECNEFYAGFISMKIITSEHKKYNYRAKNNSGHLRQMKILHL